MGGRTNERPVTDHVTSGPMRGLGKMHPMAQTNKQTSGHGDSMTELAQWADSVKTKNICFYYFK